MSNHNGSYLINDMLKMMLELKMFENISAEEKKHFFDKLTRLIRRNDCNPGEVLEDIGEELGICYYCFGLKAIFEEGECIDFCMEGSQSRINRFLKKYGTKENLIDKLAEDLDKNQARRFYNDLKAWDELEIARDCYSKGYTRTKIPEKCTGTTEIYLARLLADLRENKRKDEVSEILKYKGFSHVETVVRRLCTDIDLEDHSNETFIKTKNLLRFNDFWEYWHILNAHLADESLVNIDANQRPLSEKKVTEPLKSYQSNKFDMYKSLLKDIDLKGLKQDGVVYIYYTDDVYGDVENWYYDIEGFPAKSIKGLVVSTIGELLEKLKQDVVN